MNIKVLHNLHQRHIERSTECVVGKIIDLDKLKYNVRAS